ncbi:MAG: L-threonylcarbamoyladenylate synthase [Candidatus Delongbacteria bacterium]|nr:L-threonylcarbamoyladenylate synthase [Candidatus Delongbacteria bacterium]MDD4206053.1 L-threonylcarbamoyladenylate synthase [Candidatus Delongbacteria bacterium]
MIEMNEENPKKRDIDQIVGILRNGGVIIYPTDTGYAFGCDLFNKKGFDKLVMIKKVEKRKTFSFVCSSFSQISDYAECSKESYRIMKELLPGPYTFIMKALNSVSKTVSGEKKKVGIRIPENNIDFSLVEGLGNPLISSSLNKYSDIVEGKGHMLSDPVDIERNYGKLVDEIIACGAIMPEFSTVIDLSGEDIEIIRQGKGSTEMFSME